jgi:hypothetical protein
MKFPITRGAINKINLVTSDLNKIDVPVVENKKQSDEVSESKQSSDKVVVETGKILGVKKPIFIASAIVVSIAVGFGIYKLVKKLKK